MVNGLRMKISDKFKSSFKPDHTFNKHDLKVYPRDDWNAVPVGEGKVYLDTENCYLCTGILMGAK